MTATDELRRMLDERGADYRVSATGYSIDIGPYTTAYANRSDTTLDVSLRQVTPEQAIAATLGRDNAERYVGLRQGEYWERTENSDYYCGGCGWKVTDHDRYCPECGGALHKAALDSSNCTNGERTDAPSLPHFWTHDGTLHVELPKLPESISVRLPDVRDREVGSARVWQYALGNDGVGRTNDGLADLQAENAKLRELVCHLYYVKPRDVTSILVNGEVLNFDELMAEVGLRWEDA